MRPYILVLILLFFFKQSVQAQDLNFEPIAPIVPQRGAPQSPENAAPMLQQNPAQAGQKCGRIKNASGYRIYGSIKTDIAGTTAPEGLIGVSPEGVNIRHQETFRLERDEGLDICTSGPFFEGERLELSVRTLFPVFSCRTQIGGRVIEIKSRPREDESGVEFFAQCY